MNFTILLKSKIFLFLIPFTFFISPVYADDTEIQMDWLINFHIHEKENRNKKLLPEYYSAGKKHTII